MNIKALEKELRNKRNRKAKSNRKGVYDKEYETAHEEINYLQMLDAFSRTINSINEVSAEGASIKTVKTKLLSMVEPFIILTGIELDGKEKLKSKCNVSVVNGWVICPKCGGKTVKANHNTHFVNYPMYCKRCKQESVINL